MHENETVRPARRFDPLRCPECGNATHFAQFVDFQVNLVSADRDHLHQLWSEVARYECFRCGAAVPGNEGEAEEERRVEG